jgi:hypothetical protein
MVIDEIIGWKLSTKEYIAIPPSFRQQPPFENRYLKNKISSTTSKVEFF